MPLRRVPIVCVVLVVLGAWLPGSAGAEPVTGVAALNGGKLLDRLDQLLGIQASPPRSDQRAAVRMLAAVNRVRRRHGLRKLRRSTALMRSSRQYAEWMRANQFFGHGYFSRLVPNARRQLHLRAWGENLGWRPGGAPGVAKTLRGWLRSPPHRAVILHRGIDMAGAGLAGGRYRGKPGYMWVLHVGD